MLEAVAAFLGAFLGTLISSKLFKKHTHNTYHVYTKGKRDPLVLEDKKEKK